MRTVVDLFFLRENGIGVTETGIWLLEIGNEFPNMRMGWGNAS